MAWTSVVLMEIYIKKQDIMKKKIKIRIQTFGDISASFVGNKPSLIWVIHASLLQKLHRYAGSGAHIINTSLGWISNHIHSKEELT